MRQEPLVGQQCAVLTQGQAMEKVVEEAISSNIR